MSTYEIVYLLIFLSIVAAGSFSGGYIIRQIWLKCRAFIERTQKWQRNGGKW